MTETLTAAEVRVIREGLGVTAEWLADHLGIQTRTVQRWEAGKNPINPFAVEALLMLEQHAAEQVAEHVASVTEERLPLVMAIDNRGGTEDWPPGWQRMIAFRVRQEIPGIRISGPTMPNMQKAAPAGPKPDRGDESMTFSKHHHDD